MLLLALVAAGCGTRQSARVLAAHVARCHDGDRHALGSARVAYAGIADHGALARRAPGGAILQRFGPTNVNDYPTVFGVVGRVVNARCKTQWYRVQVPVKPNGTTAYVRVWALHVVPVKTRLLVDISARRLTVFRDGRRAWSTPVAVGSPSTPTPTGRFYVNQRLVPQDTSGPYGPIAIGISAFSNVLTGWAQGGPVAIHGTNEPWSIGHAVSNGCIRLPNATVRRLEPLAVAGTPVIIRP